MPISCYISVPVNDLYIGSLMTEDRTHSETVLVGNNVFCFFFLSLVHLDVFKRFDLGCSVHLLSNVGWAP